MYLLTHVCKHANVQIDFKQSASSVYGYNLLCRWKICNKKLNNCKLPLKAFFQYVMRFNYAHFVTYFTCLLWGNKTSFEINP